MKDRVAITSGILPDVMYQNNNFPKIDISIFSIKNCDFFSTLQASMSEILLTDLYYLLIPVGWIPDKNIILRGSGQRTEQTVFSQTPFDFLSIHLTGVCQHLNFCSKSHLSAVPFITHFNQRTAGSPISLPKLASSMAELFGAMLRVTLLLLVLGCVSSKR